MSPTHSTADRSGTGRHYKWWVVFMLWFVCVFNYADRQAIFSVFPKLKEEFGFDPVQLGLLGSAFMWVYAFGAPLAGWIADRISRKFLILGGCLFWSGVTVITGWCSRLWQFVAVRALEGLGETFYMPATLSLLGDYHDSRTRSKAFALHQSSVYAGTIFGGWLGAWFADRHGWRVGFWFFGGAGVALALVLWRFLREPARGEADSALVAAGPSTAAAEMSTPLGTAAVLRELFGKPTTRLLMAAFLGANFVATIFLTWTPTFLVDKFDFKLTSAGLSGSVFINLASACSVPLGGVLADRWARRWAGGRIYVQAIGLLAGATFVGLVGLTRTVSTLLVSMTLFGLCKGLYDSNIFASLYDVVEPRARATAAGIMNMVGWGGGALGPLAVGLATKYGRHASTIDNMSEAIAFGAIIYVVGAGLLFFAAAKSVRRDIVVSPVLSVPGRVPPKSMSSPLELSARQLAMLDLSATSGERQITNAPCGHVLTNGNVWTSDGEWLVYDVRVTDNFDGTRIERVSVITGEVELLYESLHGACCGVATFSPVEPKVIFLHGPEHPASDWTYGMTRRRGMIIDLRYPGLVRPLDAMNYAPPFTAGALRGGSHLHMFSPDGTRVSFTYEDEVLERLLAPGPNRDFNRRNIGVAGPGGPVHVAGSHPRNHPGDWFSVVVTRTVAQPEPGSDDISRAFDESWIGSDGYIRADGTRQKRALAFQGLVTAADGREYPEIFVADLPDAPMVAGDKGNPIEGTETRYPAPPPGVRQRRLTFTAEHRFPGVARAPRHWPRSSPDGSLIAFLMLDDASRPQFWSVSPTTGELRPISRHPWGVASAFSWNPSGTYLAHIMDNSVFLTEVATGRAVRLTRRQEDATAPLPLACVFSPDGRWLAYTRRAAATDIFPQIFLVAVPALEATASGSKNI